MSAASTIQHLGPIPFLRDIEPDTPLKSSKSLGKPHRSLFDRHTPHVKLIAVALAAAVVLLYFLVVPTAHDPMWWRHAGLPRFKPGQSEESRIDGPLRFNPKGNGGLTQAELRQHLTAPPRPPALPLNPHNGTEYIADYDVRKVVMDEEPALTQQHPKYLFHYVDEKKSKFPMMWLSSKPRVGWVPNFLTDEECDAIIAEASKTMARSQVVPYKDSKDANTVSEVRTSSQTWLQATSGPAKPIVDRILDFTGFPEGSSEMLQVLRYEIGQKYDAHLDYFDPKLYGPQTSNRALTAYLYLSDVEDGGYTQFPRANGKPPTWDFKSCEAGLKVRPKKGTLAIFYDMKPNGEFDDYSLHGACKPVVGTKWGGTLWLRVPTP